MMLLSEVKTHVKSKGWPRALALLAERGLFIMTVLSEKVLHCCRGSDSSNELTPEEGGEVAEPNVTKDRKRILVLCNSPDYTEVLHPEPRVSPQAKCNVLWCLVCNFMTILLAYFSFQGNMMVGSISQLHNVI